MKGVLLDMTEHIIFRAVKIPQRPTSRGGNKSMNRTLAHYRNHDRLALEHPEQSYKNRSYGYTDAEIRQKVKSAIELHNQTHKKKFRSDAAVLVECVFTYSPTARNRIDMGEYFNAVKSFIQNELKCPTLRVEYHADETTPHFHVLLLPQRGQELSANKVLGNPKHMEELQTKVAQYFEQFGLERGISKKITKKRHSELVEYKKQVMRECQSMRAEALVSDILKSEPPEPVAQYNKDRFNDYER